MTRRLLIDCGAAETVGALADDDGILRFFFAPARGDEALPRQSASGDIVLARIKSMAPALSGAFADIGDDVDAFLPFKQPQKGPPEGTCAILLVRRPALAGKGAVLTSDWTGGLSASEIEAARKQAQSGPPRIVAPLTDAAVSIVRSVSTALPDLIAVNRPEAMRALGEKGIKAVTDDRLVDDASIAENLEAALGPVTLLGDGVRMIVDETAGGAVVDIDSGGAADAARSPNDRINERVARRLFRELAQRGVGGRVLVDFLPSSTPAARRRLHGLLGSQDRSFFDCRLGKLAPDGFFDMTASRRDLSLLERASEPVADGLLRPGRRLRLDWIAKRAVKALETRLARLPGARIVLDADVGTALYLAQRPQWLARLAEIYGARFELREEKRLSLRSFDVREI